MRCCRKSPKQGRLGLEAKMRRYTPRSVAFREGAGPFSTMIGQPEVRWGRHPTGFAGTMAWVLPNPSGRNRSFTLDDLVAAYSEFRTALLGSSAKRMPRALR